MCPTDGACDTAVPNVGCNAWKVKKMHTLGSEDLLVARRISASIDTAKRFQAYGTQSLQPRQQQRKLAEVELNLRLERREEFWTPTVPKRLRPIESFSDSTRIYKGRNK